VELETDPGNVRNAHAPGVDRQGGRRAVERVEGQRVDLGATEAESGDQVEAEQVAAVRPERVPGPAGSGERVDDPQVAGQAVTVHGIEKQNVAIAPQARVPVEQRRFGRREQCLASGDRGLVARGDAGLGGKVERITDVFEPPQAEAGQGRGRGQ
jgi:hypothetical protein